VAKQAFVISDLHIGGGNADLPLEDFYQDSQFTQFLETIADCEAELIINGDFIDFAQIPPYTVPKPRELLWREIDSLQKLEYAFVAHKSCFEALGQFVALGGTCRLIIGNHDLDLAWPAVQKRFKQLLSADSSDRISFHIGHDCYLGVWIEHGNEFTPENCPVDPGNFIHKWKETGEEYLERVWGTDFMLNFYNDLERRYPFADNVKPTIAVVFQGLKNGWVGAAEFLRFVLFLKHRGVPVGALTSAVLAGKNVTIQGLVGDLDEPTWRSVVAQRARNNEFMREFNQELAALSDEERGLLSTRWPLGLSELPPGSFGDSEPSRSLGLIRADREVRAAKQRLGDSQITHVVFGHTHEIVDGELKGHLFNPGTWIPRLNLRSPEIREKLRGKGLTLDMLNDRSLYVADRLAVQITPEEEHQSHVKMVEVPSCQEWHES
jgi:UDP-2,3-diacylglucosamine pyrophosphatase LpxH